MDLVFEGQFGANDALLDYDLRDLEIAQGPLGSWLYAVNGQNGGLSVFALDATMAPQLIGSLYHSVSGLGLGGVDLGGAGLLTLGGTRGNQLVQYQIEQGGSLSPPQHSLLSGLGDQGLGSVISVDLDQGRSAVYASVEMPGEGSLLMGWQQGSEGQVLGRVATLGSEAGYDLSGRVVLATVGGAGSGADFLLVADSGGLGLRSFRINEVSGALTLADTFGPDQGLGLATPTALQALTAFGANWAILGAAGSSSLSVLRLGDDGSLSLNDHLIDSRQTRFGGLTALEVVQVEGHVFVLAAGRDDGLSLFRLVPGGQLVHVQSLAHDPGLGLQNVTALEATVMGGQIQIFASSGSTGGIARFSVALDSLGTVIEASGNSVELTGTGGDDLLLGRGSQATLWGAAGDDVLLSGSGGGVLHGGAGADIFVLCPARSGLQISDFEVGRDQIDMSHFTGLRSPGQLQIQILTNGIRLEWDNTEITVHSADGTSLTLQDLWPNGFIAPDRMPLGETLPTGIEYGSGGADRLNGDDGDNQIQGLGGHDTLNGGGGRDQLWGDDGDDVLNGGGGRDRLWGGMGEDHLQGGKAADQLWGQAGGDVLKGGGGRDRLYGGTGEDVLSGGRGRDSLLGGEGADQLFGKGGRDQLQGGAGRDVLTGGRGRDQLSGGAERDVFVFARHHGRDRISDFTPGSDQIDLSALRGEITHFGDLLLRQRGDDVLIVSGEGGIWLLDLQRSDLGGDDFIF